MYNFSPWTKIKRFQWSNLITKRQQWNPCSGVVNDLMVGDISCYFMINFMLVGVFLPCHCCCFLPCHCWCFLRCHCWCSCNWFVCIIFSVLVFTLFPIFLFLFFKYNNLEKINKNCNGNLNLGRLNTVDFFPLPSSNIMFSCWVAVVYMCLIFL